MADFSDLELLKKILEGFHAFETRHEITKDFEKLYDELRKSSLKSSNARCYSIFDFMKLYSTETISELLPFKYSKNEQILELKDCRIVEDGKISEDVEHILLGTESVEDLQQKQWVGILKYLRNEDKRSLEEKSKDYHLLRFELMANNPLIKKTDLINFKRKVYQHDALREIIEDAYEVWKEKEAILCNYCGYPMKEKIVGTSIYTCLGEDICKEFDLKYIKKEKRIITEGDYYILKKGFYIFTLLPTLFEIYCNKLVEKTFNIKVNPSPNLEANGDAEIPLNGKLIYVDYKVHKKPKKLFKKLQGDYKKEKIQYYVLPNFLYRDGYKRTLNQLNKQAGYPFNFVTEKELIKELEKIRNEGDR